MKQLQIMIAVLSLLKRYNRIKCTPSENSAGNDCGIICII